MTGTHRTPGPWEYNEASGELTAPERRGRWPIVAWLTYEDSPLLSVGKSREATMAETHANGRFMARAVNAHDALVEAIENAEANAIVGDAPTGTAILRLEDYNALITALALAKGGKP